jgi:hypothetical protein
VSQSFLAVNGDPILFKFGMREHIDALIRGELYMKPLSYFQGNEGDMARSDPNEGQAWWVQSSSATLSIRGDHGFVPIGGLKGPMAFSNPADLNTNVFCMYALKKSETSDFVDAQNLEFGDTFVCFIKSGELLKRISVAAQKTDHRLGHGFVEYIDEENHNGKMGLFRKRSVFSYQNEFRFALFPGTGVPFTLAVGDLSDIVVRGPLHLLNQSIRIS